MAFETIILDGRDKNENEIFIYTLKEKTEPSSSIQFFQFLILIKMQMQIAEILVSQLEFGCYRYVRSLYI